jgi:hypothetical protein
VAYGTASVKTTIESVRKRRIDFSLLVLRSSNASTGQGNLK